MKGPSRHACNSKEYKPEDTVAEMEMERALANM